MAEAVNHDYTPDADTEEPPSGVSRFCKFLYDSETKKVMGRTGCSWLKITLFFIVYYSCLAGFFMGMMSVFMYGIIGVEEPHRTGTHSLLDLNPGLGFRPHADLDDTLIEFTAGSTSTYAKHVANLQEFYDLYKDMEIKPDNVNVRSKCAPKDEPDGMPYKVCKFNWDTEMPNCVPGNDFGYAIGEPCVVLKLNKIYGWLPDPISDTIPHPLVECHGENPADTESIGEPDYQPGLATNLTSQTVENFGYFNQAFYPYLKQVGYRAPLVAVVFKKLRPNTVVLVECVLRNLKNSKYDKVDREAMVRFELFMKN